MKRFWNYTNFFVILSIIICLIFIYRQVIFNGKILFPSNFLAQFYSPWRTEKFPGWEAGIPHKPIGDDQIRLFYPERTFTNMCLFLSLFRLKKPAVWLGAIAFGFSGFTIVWSQENNFLLG